MIFSKKIQKAINISANQHRTHERIGLKFPYIVHPYSVALIVSEYTDDEDTFCAALLHDVIEDSTNYSFEEMDRDFGHRVTNIVRSITEEKTGSDSINKLRQNWRIRKEKYLEKLAQAPQEALIVCAADTIHNLNSLVETYQNHGELFWQSFGSSIENKIDHYGKVISNLEVKLKLSITIKLRQTYTDAKKVIVRNNYSLNKVTAPYL